MSSGYLFPEFSLDAGLVQDIRRMNPWWEAKPLPPLPRTRRHLVTAIHHRLDQRLAPIVVVRGPRQIGKTTAQLQVLDDLLRHGTPPGNIFRIQCDELPELIRLPEPILRLADWYEHTILKRSFNELAAEGHKTFLFLDEVQNLSD